MPLYYRQVRCLLWGYSDASTLVSGSSSLEIGKGFNFTGWYYVETDSAGKPLYADGSAYSEDDEYDVGKGMKMSDEEFNFEEPLKAEPCPK